jgi:hypothetical protein
VPRLYIFLAESIKYQSLYADYLTLNSTHLGLNPVYTNGPSELPLPTYDPKLEYPSTGAKQYAIQSVFATTAFPLVIPNTVDVGCAAPQILVPLSAVAFVLLRLRYLFVVVAMLV